MQPTKKQLEEFKKDFTKRRNFILKARKERYTCRQIGLWLGLSKQRVWQIELSTVLSKKIKKD